MAKSKNKKFDVAIDLSNIVYSSISKSSDGYSYARLVSKTEDKSYLTISAEWEGDKFPDFAMNLMKYMKDIKMEKSGVWPGQEEAYKIYLKEKDNN